MTFVKEVMTSVVGNSSKFEAAVVLYSTRASVKLDFSKKFNLQHFLSAIDNLPFERGYTRTDKALIISSEYIFTNDTLSRRKNVPMIAILITDGQTTKSYPDVVPVSNASEPLKQKGVRIFAVGIGLHVNQQELLDITERKDDLIYTYSFSSLLDIVDDLVNKVLSAIGKNSNPLSFNRITFDFLHYRLLDFLYGKTSLQKKINSRQMNGDSRAYLFL